jgi:hypothetical protein
MESIKQLAIGSFLPLSRMQELSQSAHASYIPANPFSHLVIDNFFDPALLDLVLNEFPKPGEIAWQKLSNGSFGSATRLLRYHLNSITFLESLSKMTGIENLLPDPSFEGGVGQRERSVVGSCNRAARCPRQ